MLAKISNVDEAVAGNPDNVKIVHNSAAASIVQAKHRAKHQIS